MVTDAGEMEEGLAEELRAQLLKPTLLFAFRHITGNIDPGEMMKARENLNDCSIFKTCFSMLRREKFLP